MHEQDFSRGAIYLSTDLSGEGSLQTRKIKAGLDKAAAVSAR